MQKATSLASAGKICLVIGSTGSIGRLVVRVLALDPRVSHITAIVRSERPKSFWFEGVSGTEVEGKIVQLTVADFSKLSEHEAAFKAGKFDSFLSGLGMYTADVKDEQEFEKVEIQYNEVVAKAAAAGGTKASAYLSGMGAVKPAQIGYFTLMFARVKGKAESMFEKLFPVGISARPGGIFGRPGGAGLKESALNSAALSWLAGTSFGIDALDIAKAMVQGSVIAPIDPNRVVENNELRTISEQYDAGLAALRGTPGQQGARAHTEKKDQL